MQAQDRPLVLIVGGAAIGRHLAAQLAEGWRVRVLDLDRAAPPLPDGAEYLQGDGTSALALQRAGAERAAALIAVTGDDERNRECARLARERFGVRRVVAVLDERDGDEELAALGVELVPAAPTVATILANRLEQQARTAVNVGLGHGEIVEITLLPTSGATGRPLRELRPRGWLVAAVYRGDRLIVPHGDTELRAGDRVLLVGEPGTLPAAAEFLRTGRCVFPMPYGPRLGVVAASAPPRLWDEVDYLLGVTTAAGADVFGTDPLADIPPGLGYRAVAGGPRDALRAAQAQADIGCVVLPAASAGLLEVAGLRASLPGSALASIRKPLIMARGSIPYRRVVLPISASRSARPAAELAVGLAHLLGAALTAVTVTPPAFVAGARSVGEQVEPLDEIERLAEAYRLPVERRHQVGNPIRAILELTRDAADLLVLGHAPGRAWPLRPDVSAWLAQRATCSTLVLPLAE